MCQLISMDASRREKSIANFWFCNCDYEACYIKIKGVRDPPLGVALMRPPFQAEVLATPYEPEASPSDGDDQSEGGLFGAIAPSREPLL